MKTIRIVDVPVNQKHRKVDVPVNQKHRKVDLLVNQNHRKVNTIKSPASNTILATGV